MHKAEQLQDILRAMVDFLDPHGVGETIVLRLQHDTGMRLLNSLPAEDVRAAFAQGLARDLSGLPIYEASVGGVTIQWPSRRVDLGHGKVEYI